MRSRYFAVCTVICAVLLCFAGVEARAQAYAPSSELYVGMSVLIQSDRLIDTGDLGVGVDVSYTRFLTGNFGLMFNGAAYTSAGALDPLLPTADFTSQFVMAGPRVVKRWNRFAAHAHGLAGMNHEKTDPGIFDPLLPAVTNTAFTWSVGGGFDLNITKNVGIRLFQVDIGRTNLPNALFGDPVVMRTTFITGVSIKWGDL